MASDTWTPEDRSDAEIWIAVGYHLDQALLAIDEPFPLRERVSFHVSEARRQLALVNDSEAPS